MPSFEMIKGSKMTPQQDNGCDCGVFMLATIDLLRRGLPVTFSQNDLTRSQYRLRIASMLIMETTELEGQAALETERGELEHQQEDNS